MALNVNKITFITSMHSSRMLITRRLTVSGRGGGGGSPSEGGLPSEGVCLLRGGLPSGPSDFWVRICLPMALWKGRHDPVNKMTDASENIAFAILLMRAVKKLQFYVYSFLDISHGSLTFSRSEGYQAQNRFHSSAPLTAC